MKTAKIQLSVLLWGVAGLFRVLGKFDDSIKKHLKEKNFTAQFRIKDGSVARWFTFNDGKVTSRSGINAQAEVVLTYHTA